MRSFLLALACALLAACGTPDTGPKMGSAAPPFEATDLDGKRHRFPEDFAGKPVILDFWADYSRRANSMTERRRGSGVVSMTRSPGRFRSR